MKPRNNRTRGGGLGVWGVGCEGYDGVWPGRKGMVQQRCKEVRGELCVYPRQENVTSAKTLRQEYVYPYG